MDRPVAMRHPIDVENYLTYLGYLIFFCLAENTHLKQKKVVRNNSLGTAS